MPINLKGGGAKAAHGAGRAAHGVGSAARAAGKVGQSAAQGVGGAAGKIGQGLGKAGNIAGRLGARAGERTAHGAERAGHYGGRSIGSAATQVGKQVAKIGEKVLDKGIEAAGTAIGGAAGKVVAQVVEKHKKEALILLLIIIIGSFLPILFFLFILLGASSAQQQQQGQQQQQQNPLQITKTGPTQAQQGDNLNYTITVTYPGSAQDALITDPLPDGTTYVCSSVGIKPCKAGENKDVLTNNILTWDAKALKIPLKDPLNITIQMTLRATKNDTNIVNIATANLIGSSLSGAGCGNFNKSATTFDTLMTGQGRCINALGNDQKSFVTAIQKNGAKFNLGGRDAQLGQIYTAAVAQKVNPVILITIWGVESTFGTAAGENFNCGNFHDPFPQSLSCAVSTLNHYMTYFENQKTKPVAIGNCKYNDPFLYAYEWYTPVCHASDNNGASRANFVNIYKQLMGV